MLQLASGHIAAQAIHVFAALGLPDLLREGAKDAVELARATQADSAVLYRVLRYLATLGVVGEDEKAQFSLTPLGRTLCSRPTSVIRDNTLLVASRYYWAALGGLLHSVKTGETAFRQVYERDFFDHLAGNPADADVFNAAMNSSSQIGVAAILSSYDFSGFGQIVDVAGGKGALLTGILKRNPAVRGVLYDSASVDAQSSLDPSVSGRLSKVGGNFFEHVPPGGDAYILRRILHDWDDGKAVEILRQCRKAMGADGRLLIIELAAPDRDQSGNDWATMDLLMMLMLNGRERTAQDFEQLFALAGFRLTRTIRTRSAYWIVEAVPV